MGIEKQSNGVYVPDKTTKWPQMTDPERSKVYESHKEKYGGRLSQLDSKQEMAKKKITADVKQKLGMEIEDFWQEIAVQDFKNEFEAGDAKLKGMPVSMALLLTFKEKFAEGDAQDAGLLGKEKQLMFFCLDYLQNAPENKAIPNTGNIDLVPKDGKIKIAQDQSNDWRWQLIVEDSKGVVLFNGYLFPPDF